MEVYYDSLIDPRPFCTYVVSKSEECEQTTSPICEVSTDGHYRWTIDNAHLPSLQFCSALGIVYPGSILIILIV